MYRKRTISAWQREEDGSYKADLDGYRLHVKWRPESADAGRGFLWSAEGPESPAEGDTRPTVKIEADDVVEEIEQAMGDAEYALRLRLHPELV